MIRATVIALLLFTAAVLQTALFPHITLAGFRPDLLLLLTAIFALREGPLTGTAVGFGAGMLGDLLLAHPPLGLSGIVLLAVGYAVGVLRPYFAVGSVTPPLIVAFVSGLAATVGYGVLSRLLGDPRFALAFVLQAALVVALYNTLLASPAFMIVSSLSTRFPSQRNTQL
ncbi:MAG: rod shape-determining protein MreD [Actinomycetota bacterium]|nr:rod shape-determining protein MreD [Actinomycetota bacterium]